MNLPRLRPTGYPDAVIWKGGHRDGSVQPVAHSLTDAYALLGTVAAIDILGLPFYAVPMWAQYRHDMKLAPLSWFGNMPCISIKWSTAGDAYVNGEGGERVVVMGKSGNAPLRTQAGVYCNVRPYGADHGGPLHALPAVLPGQVGFRRRSRDRDHPLRDEHAGRSDGVRGAAVPADGQRNRPHGPGRLQTHPGPGRRRQCGHPVMDAAGHEIPGWAAVRRRRLRGTPGAGRPNRQSPARGLQGRYGELGRAHRTAYRRHETTGSCCGT